MAVLNDRKGLKAAIESYVRPCARGGVELVAADGGSTDGSLEVCRQAEAAYPWFRLVRVAELGIYNAWNVSMREVPPRGPLVFCGVDDLPDEQRAWVYGAVAGSVARIQRRRCESYVVFFRPAIRLFRLLSLFGPRAKLFLLRSGIMAFQHAGSLFCPCHVGGGPEFDGSLKISADWKWLAGGLARRAHRVIELTSVPSPLGVGVGGVSKTPRGATRGLREVWQSFRYVDPGFVHVLLFQVYCLILWVVRVYRLLRARGRLA